MRPFASRRTNACHHVARSAPVWTLASSLPGSSESFSLHFLVQYLFAGSDWFAYSNTLESLLHWGCRHERQPASLRDAKSASQSYGCHSSPRRPLAVKGSARLLPRHFAISAKAAAQPSRNQALRSPLALASRDEGLCQRAMRYATDLPATARYIYASTCNGCSREARIGRCHGCARPAELVAISAHPERTIFTRFIPAQSPARARACGGAIMSAGNR